MKSAALKLFLILMIIGFTASNLWPQDYSYSVYSDISYIKGGAEEQKLNLIIPEGNHEYPLLIWIGGGAWSFVDRNIEMDLGKKMASAGIAFASIGHRLSRGLHSPQAKSSGVTFPAHVEDVAAAFAFLVREASTYKLDPSHIFIGGYSSGAQLATLLTMDKKYLDQHHLSVNKITGIIPVAGAYDILHYYRFFKDHADPSVNNLVPNHIYDVFGTDTSQYIAASPSNYLEGNSHPMLLIADNALTHYTTHFEKILRSTNYPDFTTIYVEDKNHGELWRDLSFSEKSEVRQSIVNFIFEHSKR